MIVLLNVKLFSTFSFVEPWRNKNYIALHETVSSVEMLKGSFKLSLLHAFPLNLVHQSKDGFMGSSQTVKHFHTNIFQYPESLPSSFLVFNSYLKRPSVIFNIIFNSY